MIHSVHTVDIHCPNCSPHPAMPILRFVILLRKFPEPCIIVNLAYFEHEKDIHPFIT
jgi:hypothetical protein